jgi:hypothetical protein
MLQRACLLRLGSDHAEVCGIERRGPASSGSGARSTDCRASRFGAHGPEAGARGPSRACGPRTRTSGYQDARRSGVRGRRRGQGRRGRRGDCGLWRGRRRRGCRRPRGSRGGRGRGSRRRRRRWCGSWSGCGGRGGRDLAGRQGAERIDVAVLVRGDADPEVNVRSRVFRRTTWTGRPHRRAFGYGRAPVDREPAKVRQRDGVPVGSRDRDRQTVRRHAAGERHGALRRRANQLVRVSRDVDASVLPAGVRVVAEHEWPQDRAAHGP